MSTTSTTAAKAENSIGQVQFLTITALFIALTYVFTAFVNVRLPITANGGLIHLGNVPLFICAILFGKKSGALAGGIGMGLFDLLSGWTAWAPFTFVIVAIMGYVVGAITEKHHGLGFDALAIVAACDQSSRLLYRRRNYLWELDRTVYFHSWKSGTDRCCSRCGSDRYRAASQSSKQNHF